MNTRTEYIVADKENNSREKISWHDRLENKYLWIGRCNTNDYCPLDLPDPHPCKNHYCPKDGWKHRKDKVKELLLLGQPVGDCWFITLKFDYYVPPKVVSNSRQTLFKSLTRAGLDFKYLWRLHFMFQVPHIQMCLWSIVDVGQNLIKPRWTKILKSIHHPNPEGSRVGLEYVHDYPNKLGYLFETKRDCFGMRAAPCIPNQQWRYWSKSNF